MLVSCFFDTRTGHKMRKYNAVDLAQRLNMSTLGQGDLNFNFGACLSNSATMMVTGDMKQ